MKKNQVKLKTDEYSKSFLIKLTRIMKISVLLLFLSVASVFATESYSQTTKLTLALNDASVERVLNTIESHSEFFFLYNHQLVDVNRKVDIEVKNVRIKDILNRLFAGTDVRYIVLGRQIILTPEKVLKEDISKNLRLQQIKVTGTVTDENGNTLPGVNIVVKGTTTGTITNAKGEYTLSVDPNATLVFSFVGFKSQEVPVAGKSVIDVSLVEEAIGLKEVVAIGFGTARKATLTGSIAAVKGKELKRSPAPNLSNSLAGQLPGLVVISRTGEPGNDNSVLRIRGVNTLGDNTPLVIVDGIPNRSLDRLDPSEIASITVLKDASAAIYGSEAANGVILITTKRGKTGKPTITFNYRQGFNSPTVLPKMADAALYAQLINEIKYYAGADPKYTAEDIQKYKDGSDPWGHPNTDWFKETIKPWSPQNYQNISLSGGAEKVKYFVSFGHTYQDGIYRKSATNYSQGNFRSNLDADVTKHIHVSLDVAARQENRNYSGVGYQGGQGALNIWWGLNRAYPYLPAYWPTGQPGPDVEYGSNPVVTVTDATGYDKSINYILQSNLKLAVEIPWIKGLSITGNASIDKNILNRKRFQKPWYLYYWDGVSYDANNVPELVAGKKGFSEPRLTQWMDDGRQITLNGLINYKRTFSEKHMVKFLVGAERITGNSMNFWAFRRYFTSEALDQMFAGGDKLKDNGGSGNESARLNYFGRVNYSFKEKYLAEFVWRYDGSYIFPEASRFGFFPGVSLGWRVSQEKFWKNNISFINEMKIRGSWGQTGNDRIAPYQFMTTYGYNNTYIFNYSDQQKTLRALRIPNPNITWEVANESNIGFDSRMLKDKLTFSMDYFYNLRSNILWYRNASVPYTAGFTLPRENIGKVVNQGFEFMVGWNDKFGDFTYSLSANGAVAHNKIKFWDETPGIPEYQRSTGKPVYADLYYQYIGVFKDQAAVDAYPHWPGARPGDIIFKDVNKDGIINGLDRVRNSKTSIPIFTGGFNASLGYKNIYLNILFQGAAGAVRSYRTFSGEAGNFLYNDVKDRWTPEHPNSKYPRTWNRSKEYWMTDGHPNNTYWVRSSNYLRLKNLELGYNLPSKIVKKVGVQNLGFYVSGLNLLTFTPMKDFDPESPDQADGSIWVNSEVYPLNKTLSFGVNVTF